MNQSEVIMWRNFNSIKYKIRCGKIQWGHLVGCRYDMSWYDLDLTLDIAIHVYKLLKYTVVIFVNL